MEKICGVYKITNIINGKFYIGSSSDINTRWYRHRYDFSKGSHHSQHFQNAWDKYGEENFVFEVVEETTEDNKLEKEQYYLNLLKPWDNKIGYNLKDQVEGGSLFGEDSSRAKLSNKEVEEIKLKYIEGESTNNLSITYNVSTSTIERLLVGKTYKNIRTDLSLLILEQRNNAISRQELAFNLKSFQNKSKEEIAQELGCSKNRVMSLISRERIKLGIAKKSKSKEEKETQKQEIIELYKQGNSIINIIKMGYAKTTVRRNINKFIDKPLTKNKTKAVFDKQRIEIVDLFVYGVKESEIIQMGYAKSTVQKNIRKYKNNKLIKNSKGDV